MELQRLSNPKDSDSAPVFARWHDDSGTSVDVRLRWHSNLPSSLPAVADETICLVQLCVSAAASEPLDAEPRFLEARMQRFHLLGSDDTWTARRLQRLMNTMANPCDAPAPGGGEPTGDMVQLRRGPGHMVIDVFFIEAASTSSTAFCIHPKAKVVEILNAHPCGTSSRTSAKELLQSIAMAQYDHRRKISQAQKQLEASRAAVDNLQKRWDVENAKVERDRRDRIRRFTVLLQAKVKKEMSLQAELAAQKAGTKVVEQSVAGTDQVPITPAGTADGQPARGGRAGGARGIRGGRTARGRGRGRGRAAKELQDHQQQLEGIPEPLPKRHRVTIHDSILSAATLPPPPAEGATAATLGRSALEAILEPDAAADERDRRKATMAQAILEPDAVTELDKGRGATADMMLDPVAMNAEVHLQSAPLLSQSMPLTQCIPHTGSSTPQVASAASHSSVAPPAANVATLGLFDPVSSDDEAPPARSDVPAARSYAPRSAEVIERASQAKTTGQTAAQTRLGAIGRGLFYSDDEDE